MGHPVFAAIKVVNKSRDEQFWLNTKWDFSMTILLTHTVAHSTFTPKTNNQPPKKFLSLALSWAEVVKNGKILTFKVNFLSQKLSKSFKKKFIEEYDFRGTLFVIDIFWKLQFSNHSIF